MRKTTEGVGRGLSHGTQDVSSLGSTHSLGLTGSARVGLVATLYWDSSSYLAIGGGGFGENLIKVTLIEKPLIY